MPLVSPKQVTAVGEVKTTLAVLKGATVNGSVSVKHPVSMSFTLK